MPPTIAAAEIVVQVRAEMARQDVSLPQLATALGVRYATLRKRLANPATLKYSDISAVSQALGVPASQLIERAEQAAA